MSSIIKAAEAGELWAWRKLVRTGAVWHLDPWFGHMAASLIAAGSI